MLRREQVEAERKGVSQANIPEGTLKVDVSVVCLEIKKTQNFSTHILF